jgi:hypothetical protein
MSSRSLNRKDFLVLTVSATAIAAFLEACGGDDPATTTGAAGTGTGGSGTAGTGTAGTGTAGTGTAGTGTAGTATGGSSSGSNTGGSATAGTGTGGVAGGSGGASGGSGGASGGSGGAGGGGMCGAVSIMQTSNEMHDHIPDDPTMLKADLKTLINGATPTMKFTTPKDGMGAGHTHTITLTVPEAVTLKGGGMVTGKKTDADDTQHSHTYTIGCTA